MTINRNNFEAYLLDYLEGNLDPLLTADLMAFLAENPEYEKYIPETQSHSLTPDNHEFGFKQQLKKEFNDIPAINDYNFDEFCIASVEGLLDARETARLNEYIAGGTERQKNLRLYGKLRLQPDLTIEYPEKERIRKQSRGFFRMRYLYYGLALAASVAVLFMLTLKRPVDDLQGNSPVIVADSRPAQNTNEEPARIITAPDKPDPVAESLTELYEAPENPATTVSEFREPVHLANLERVTRKLESPVTASMPEIPVSVPAETRIATKTKQPRIDSENLIVALFSKINFWKTAETAIIGFNYLTEAQLSIDKTTDGTGRLTGLSLNTESYTIAGKTK